MILLTTILLIMTVVVPIVIYVRSEKGLKAKKVTMLTNIAMFFVSVIVIGICMFTGNASAQTAVAAVNPAAGWGYIAVALSTGFSTVGAGIAVGAAASAALGALSENEKVFGKALIFVALAEGIALYGVLVSVLILSKL